MLFDPFILFRSLPAQRSTRRGSSALLSDNEAIASLRTQGKKATEDGEAEKGSAGGRAAGSEPGVLVRTALALPPSAQATAAGARSIKVALAFRTPFAAQARGNFKSGDEEDTDGVPGDPEGTLNWLAEQTSRIFSRAHGFRAGVSLWRIGSLAAFY